MALVALDGRAVIRGKICMPRIGAWHADLEVENQDDTPTGALKLRIGSDLELSGRVDRALNHRGIADVRFVGGGNGLRGQAKPKFYRGALLGEVLDDLCRDGGEKVSATSDSTVLAQRLAFWATIGNPVGVMVAALVQAAPEGTAWRLLPDGSLWVGAESWPDSAIEEWTEIDADGCNLAVEIGTEAPVLLPGTVLGDRRIDYVEHTIEPDRIRSIAWAVPS